MKAEVTRRSRPKMLAWAKESNSHGLVLHSVLWLPENDLPETGGLYTRIPLLDCPAGEYDSIQTNGGW
jgi:hypothetical protein